jgi:hypothetical protein
MRNHKLVSSKANYQPPDSLGKTTQFPIKNHIRQQTNSELETNTNKVEQIDFENENPVEETETIEDNYVETIKVGVKGNYGIQHAVKQIEQTEELPIQKTDEIKDQLKDQFKNEFKDNGKSKFTAHQSFIDPNIQKEEKLRKPSSGYDFADKANPENSLETFSEQKKEQIKGKILKNKFSQNNSALIILVIVIICLTSLCAFTTYQIYKYEKQTTAVQKVQQVGNNLQTWSGPNFETSFSTNLNDQFQRENKDIDFEFLDNKKGQIYSYLSRDQVDGENYNSGILIYSTEFDNKIGQEEFTQKVLAKSNSEYLSTDQKIAFSGDIVAYKLANKNKKTYTSMYPVVTSNNYYVVKVINPGQELPQLNQKNRLIEELLSQLKLK